MRERITRHDLEKATEALVEAGATGEWVSTETMLAAALLHLGIEVEGVSDDSVIPSGPSVSVTHISDTSVTNSEEQ